MTPSTLTKLAECSKENPLTLDYAVTSVGFARFKQTPSDEPHVLGIANSKFSIWANRKPFYQLLISLRHSPHMQNRNSLLSAEIWLQNLFASQAVMRGEVIRRKRRDVERFVGMELFMAEIQRRGFQVIENAGQLVIFCNRAPIRRVTPVLEKNGE